MTDPRVAIVVEWLRSEGWEPAEDQSQYDGTLEAMAEKLLEALPKCRHRYEASGPIAVCLDCGDEYP